VKLSVAFAALASGIVVWWLIVRRLTARPWEAQGSTAGREAAGVLDPAPARTGLWVFLAVLTSLFALCITGYWMRMGHGPAAGVAPIDWRPLTEPRVLWLNTALLVLGSVSMQWARHAADRGDAARTQIAWLCGGVFAAAFIVGQGIAWRQLQAAGAYAASNPGECGVLPADGLARRAPDRRPRGVGAHESADVPGRFDCRVDTTQCRALHRLLALPVAGVAGAVRTAVEDLIPTLGWLCQVK
jgi:hypothetical protein